MLAPDFFDVAEQNRMVSAGVECRKGLKVGRRHAAWVQV